jgi:hypothetical protein
MDPLVDLEKAPLTQTRIEDVEDRRNLSMKSIEVIDEVDAEILETRLMQPVKLISLTEDFIHKKNKV